jgi:predicted ArsR family transcriptional regulator
MHHQKSEIRSMVPVSDHSSDEALMDLLRRRGGLGVQQLMALMSVTATAVRQRLNRLMAAGLIQRTVRKVGRGRPSHCYELTEKGLRQTGSNFADLATALWQEIRTIEHADVRRGLLQRLSQRLAAEYAEQITGETTEKRMQQLVLLLADRDIPFEVQRGDDQLPVLRALGCPYTELAEKDRSICSMERMMFSELVGENLRLTDCRLDGGSCCTFETSQP